MWNYRRFKFLLFSLLTRSFWKFYQLNKQKNGKKETKRQQQQCNSSDLNVAAKVIHILFALKNNKTEIGKLKEKEKMDFAFISSEWNRKQSPVFGFEQNMFSLHKCQNGNNGREREIGAKKKTKKKRKRRRRRRTRCNDQNIKSLRVECVGWTWNTLPVTTIVSLKLAIDEAMLCCIFIVFVAYTVLFLLLPLCIGLKPFNRQVLANLVNMMKIWGRTWHDSLANSQKRKKFLYFHYLWLAISVINCYLQHFTLIKSWRRANDRIWRKK